MKRFLCGMGVAVALCVLADAAGAIPYGNPAHSAQQGEWPAEVRLESARRPLTSGASDGPVVSDAQLLSGAFAFGVGPAGLLSVQTGMLTGSQEGGAASRGTLFGVNYRRRLGGADLPQGLMFALHAGFVGNDTSETRLTQVDLGYGVAVPLAVALAGPMTGYLGGVISRLTGTVAIHGSGGHRFAGANPIGLFAGLERTAGPYLKFGGEVHLLHETSIGVYAAGRF